MTYIFILKLLYGASKDFVEAIKAFIKPFDALQRIVKTNILSFYFNTTL